MIAPLLLASLAVIGGAVATYAFDREAPAYARLAMGAVLGLTLLAFAGFGLALLLDLTAPTLVLAALVTAVPFLTLRSRDRRVDIAADLAGTGRAIAAAFSRPTIRAAVTVLYGAAIAVGTWLVADRTLIATAEGLAINNVNNLGDLPYHLHITASFAYGGNFPPENPVFAGAGFSYHYIADFLAAMFVAAGSTLFGGMFLVTVVVGNALLALVHRWTREITGDAVAARIAPLLLVFSGGLGWVLLLEQARAGESGVLAAFLGSDARYTIQPDGLLRFGNAVTALLIPQRGLLLGMALAVVAFTLLWRSVDAPVGPDDPAAGWRARVRLALRDRRMLVAGVLTGILPIVHLHTFAVVFGTAFFLGLAFQGWRHGRWRGWVVYVVVTLAIALPLVAWTARGSRANLTSFFGLELGWDRGSHDPVTFWLANTGLFIPLLAVAYLWRGDRPVLSRKLLLYSLPFLAWFIIPNVVRLAPWLWDNIKVLTYWWLGAVPLVALVVARVWRARTTLSRIGAVGACLVLMGAGALDVGRATVGPSYRIFDRDAIALAEMVRERTGPDDVILTAPTYDSPIFLTGRRVFMGYAGFLWSNGLPYVEREEELRAIYAGDPSASDLIARNGIAYILLGPQERAGLAPDEAFLSRFPIAAEIGPYRLYRTRGV
jgi:hypothetical protein